MPFRNVCSIDLFFNNRKPKYKVFWLGGVLKPGEEEGDGRTLLINYLLKTLFRGQPGSTYYDQHAVAQTIYKMLFDHSI